MLLEQTELASVPRQQRAEGAAASPGGAQLCHFIVTRPPLSWGQCGTRKQSFYQERDLLPRGTRSAVVDVAAEKDLWENLRQCLTEIRVMISAATALLHTAQVWARGHYIFMWPVCSWVFFFLFEC